jgi:hypothetical protein
MIDIDSLTIGEAKRLRAALGGDTEPRVPLPFKVGDAILVRSVTMIDLGRVVSIGRDFIVLEDGGWVADTGRFSTMLATGALGEFEKAPSWMLVGRGAICDVFPWPHALPKDTK